MCKQILMIAAAFALVLVIGIISGCGPASNYAVKGEIVDAYSNEPIENANITIKSYNANMVGKATDFFEYHNLSDEYGRFDFEGFKGYMYDVYISAIGYYPYTYSLAYSENKIKLYPVINPQNISEKTGSTGVENAKLVLNCSEPNITDEEVKESKSGVVIKTTTCSPFFNISDGKNATAFGYSFSEGNITNDLESADIFMTFDDNRFILVANGEGGFISLTENDFFPTPHFYNTHEAPLEGYQKEIELSIYYYKFLFFKTADGKHYGKMFVSNCCGYDAVENKSFVAFNYIYNPEENNRNLEIVYPAEGAANLNLYRWGGED